ncbi:MAG: hypothetical protein WB816_16075, partial [Methylocystis sp.]
MTQDTITVNGAAIPVQAPGGYGPAIAAYFANGGNNPPGSAAFAASQASIGTAATQIVAARAGVAGTGRIAATLYNA